jgi:hypothetical protein
MTITGYVMTLGLLILTELDGIVFFQPLQTLLNVVHFDLITPEDTVTMSPMSSFSDDVLLGYTFSLDQSSASNRQVPLVAALNDSNFAQLKLPE